MTNLPKALGAITILLSVLSLGLSSCGPQLRVPRASLDQVEAERQAQLDSYFLEDIAQRIRLFRVYSRLRTQSSQFCGKNLVPHWGLFVVDLGSFSTDQRNRAARLLNLGADIRILAVAPGTSAARAGIKDGDVVRKVSGVVMESFFSLRETSEVGFVKKLLDKAGGRPVEIEVKRPSGNLTTVVEPDLACPYTLVLVNSPNFVAQTDGTTIYLSKGALRFYIENDDELALILAHELSHISLGHIERQKTNVVIGTLIGTALDIGIAAGLGVNTQGLAGRIGADAGRIAFSKEFEMEADYLGLYFMGRSGFDISKAPNVFRKFAVLSPASTKDNYSLTHPSSPERAAAMGESIREVTLKLSRGEALLPERLEAKNELPLTEGGTELSRRATEQHTLRPQSMQAIPKTERKEEQVALKTTGAEKTVQPPVRTKRFATLKHQLKTSRGSVDSGISLELEYYDTGTGRGPVRVISPNHVMDGEYWTVKANESFKNLVSASLLNPDTLTGSSPEDSKSFARLTGEGGILVECIYVVTRTGMDNRGLCFDNKGNQYRLIF